MQGKRKGYLILHSIEYLTRLRLRKKKTHSLFSLLPLSVSLHPFPPNPRPSPLSLYSFPPLFYISPHPLFYIFSLNLCVRSNQLENLLSFHEGKCCREEGEGKKSSWRGREGKNQVGGEETEVEGGG